LRSQRHTVVVCRPPPVGNEVVVSVVAAGMAVAVVISTTKTPPVAGCRATSPRAVENVERSSWANYEEAG
jgi:hypothetical protein